MWLSGSIKSMFIAFMRAPCHSKHVLDLCSLNLRITLVNWLVAGHTGLKACACIALFLNRGLIRSEIKKIRASLSWELSWLRFWRRWVISSISYMLPLHLLLLNSFRVECFTLATQHFYSRVTSLIPSLNCVPGFCEAYINLNVAFTPL